ANVIEAKRERKAERVGFNDPWEQDGLEPQYWARLRDAIEEVERNCRSCGFSERELIESLQSFAGNSVESIILEACIANHVSAEDLLTDLTQLSLQQS